MNKLTQQNSTVSFITLKETKYNPGCIEFYAVSEIDTTGYTVMTKAFPSKVKINGQPCIFYSVKPN